MAARAAAAAGAEGEEPKTKEEVEEVEGAVNAGVCVVEYDNYPAAQKAHRLGTCVRVCVLVGWLVGWLGGWFIESSWPPFACLMVCLRAAD